MKRYLLKLCITWWADGAAPGWLRRLSARDSHLVAHERALRQLANELQADAADWSLRVAEDVGEMSPRPGVVVVRQARRRTLSRRVGLGAAAAIACSIAGFFLIRIDGPDPDIARSRQGVSAFSDASNSDTKALLCFYDAGTQVADRLTAGASVLIEQDVAQATAQQVSSAASVVAAPLQEASRSYGRSLAILDDSLSEQATGLKPGLGFARDLLGL